MIRSFRYLKPYIWTIIVVLALVLLRTFLELMMPFYLGKLIDDASSLFLSNENKETSIIYYGSMMLGITIVSIGVMIFSRYLGAKIAALYGKKLRSELYKNVQTFSLKEVDEFTPSSLITRSTNDIQAMQQTLAMLLRMAVLAPFTAIGAIAMAFIKHPTISTVLIVSIISVLSVLYTIYRLAYPKFSLIQKLADKMNLVVRENLTGLKVVRAFNTEEFQIDKSRKVAQDTMDNNVFVNRLFSAMWPVMGFVMQLTTALMYVVAIYFGFLKENSAFTPGDLSSMVQYGTQTLHSFMMMTMILIMLPRSAISANRVMDVIDKKTNIFDGDDLVKLDDLKGEVSFNKVSFKYPNSDESVLKDISFKAKPNEVTAFIGSTGSGKSTLINLVPRFYDVTDGEILIDNVNVKNYKLDDLYQLFGYVPQQGILFKGTIKSNVGFGVSNINDEELNKALDISQSKDFVEKLDDKYDSPISQGGTNVSGGQRQRLSIARAIAKKPKIYIFDDSFSALDYKTDAKLREALDENIKATILIVAQRINTIKNADKIIVLDKGRIVGIGKHYELLKSCEVYKEIAESQLTPEELLI
ncbi:MAG: ABC transporter ATP-binding protein [Acholeplasmataceae bacterium]